MTEVRRVRFDEVTVEMVAVGGCTIGVLVAAEKGLGWFFRCLLKRLSKAAANVDNAI